MSKVYLRSQDRQQVKEIKEVWISSERRNNPNNYNMYDEGKTYYTIIADGDRYGSYETKDRALQVLDEICSALSGKLLVNVNKTTSKAKDKELLTDNNIKIEPLNYNVVYQMPKE